jgi:hypothetical protein
MYAVSDPIFIVRHIFYWICDTKNNISITIQILDLPSFFTPEDETIELKKLLIHESPEVDLKNIVVKPVSDFEEGLIFELALQYANDAKDLFGPKKVSPEGIQYRILQL